MSLGDIKILYNMVFRHGHGTSHADRLNDFYSSQAGDYDAFRKRFLVGRSEMMNRTAETQPNAIWVDMGGGTGSNLENIANLVPKMKKIYIVDLASSLLEVARERIKKNGWTNVVAVEADATTFTPEEGYADIVTFSYSLTMIPDWYAALDNARRILRPGGTIGLVDFFVSRKWPNKDQIRHSWFTRNYWPVHFSTDNVFLSHDHIPYLNRYFKSIYYVDGFLKIPYVALIRVPYYIFVGKKPENDA